MKLSVFHRGLLVSLALHGVGMWTLTTSWLSPTQSESVAVVVDLYVPSIKQVTASPITPRRSEMEIPTSPRQALEARPSPSAVKESKKGVSSEGLLRSQEGKRLAATYAEQLKVYLEQNKFYPRTALRLKHTGTVRVRLQIRMDGEFGEIEIITPSPFATLNQAAIKLLRDLGRFKPLPPTFAQGKEFVVPIAYQLKSKAL